MRRRLIVVNHGKIAFDDAPKAVFAHYRELEAMGLAAPQITYIMHALKEKGLAVDPQIQRWRKRSRIFCSATLRK